MRSEWPLGDDNCQSREKKLPIIVTFPTQTATQPTYKSGNGQFRTQDV